MEYWQSRVTIWPDLTAIAFDLIAILAISSEYKRVFSSTVKMTTQESRRLLGKTLWHHQTLKNWLRRGAVDLELYLNAVKVQHCLPGEVE